MIVYGKRKTKYVLSKKPIRGDGESAVYPISGREDILVKVYQKSMRTTEKEYQVMEAINGSGTMLGEYPLDIVYERGKFVGYTFEKEEVYTEPEDVPVTLPIKKKDKMSPSVIVTLSVVLGIILSIAMYMWVFPIISKSILINNLPFYFKGVPMIVGGWLGFAFVFAKLGCQEFPTFILSIIMFVLGNVAVFGITWMIITMFRMAVSIVWAILPSVIMIAAIIYLVKRVLH